MYIRKLNLLILFILSFFCIFGYVVFSDAVNTIYTEFYFVDSNNQHKQITMNLIGGATGNVVVKLENKGTENLIGKLNFVDGITQIVNGKQVKMCLSDNEKLEFGQYVSIDNDLFNIIPGNSGVRNLSLNFPAWYSGLYNGCVVYIPNINELNNSLNTSARKAIFLDLNFIPSMSGINLVVRPAFRPNKGERYSMSGVDFWFFVYENGIWQKLYNSSLGGDPKISFDKDGLATVYFIPPSSGSQYMLALKSSGSLSLGYTGIRKSNITGFNFYSGVIADSLSDEFMIKHYNGSFTGNYLRMGDVSSNSSGNYDIIKDADFALMSIHLSRFIVKTHPDWFDLDLNNVINALEQTMLLNSYNKVGFIIIQNDINLSEFINI